MRISDWSSDVCSSDIHDAAHALDHEVIASPIGIRPGLSEAGDRAIDKAGIYRPQAVRIQAIFAQPPDLEILDHDVGPARKLTDLSLSLRRGHVDRDGPLAAIDRKSTRLNHRP